MIKILISSTLILFALVLHAYDIVMLPSGLYLDEASIGLNAANIALQGVDEYGKSFPLYFEAFGEWKNPLYIYASAGIMNIFGISDFTLRLTSVFFFGIFLLGIYLFISEIFKKRKYGTYVLYFALISASLMPWFFTLSRVAFEVISQISMGIFVLYFLYKYYVSVIDQENKYSQSFYASSHIFGIVSGISLGLFLYSYSTSKLIAFGILFALFISFFEKKYWKKHTIVLGSFLLFVLPYLYFSYMHSGALSVRFEALTYIYDSNISIGEKISIFLKNYCSSYDISSFLLFEGDKNVRHSTGFMGQILFVPFVLFIIGMYKIFSDVFTTEIKSIQKREYLENKKYKVFLLLLLLGAPIPASLTVDIHHSLRLLFFGFLIFIFSLYGAASLFQKYSATLKNSTIFLLLLLPTLFQSYFYYSDYFADYFGSYSGYAKRSIQWFDGDRFDAHTQFSVSLSGATVVFENPNDPFYANVEFENIKRHQPPIIMTKNHSLLVSASCIIVPRKNIPEFTKRYENYTPDFATTLFTTYCDK